MLDALKPYILNLINKDESLKAETLGDRFAVIKLSENKAAFTIPGLTRWKDHNLMRDFCFKKWLS
ncbi:MAG: hypothetical protein K940chlam7_00313 [Chlamydiae bacterium]|nr:hypothetical protein [Chlamydiota bacterium]